MQRNDSSHTRRAFICDKLATASSLLKLLDSSVPQGISGEPLRFLALCDHLEELAKLVREGDEAGAVTLHESFSVVPHAVWLGRAARRRLSTDQVRSGAAKGGKARTPKKRAAARENGRKGGRKPVYRPDELVRQLLELATKPDAIPTFSSVPARAILAQAQHLPVRVRQMFWNALKREGTPPNAIGLPSGWRPRWRTLVRVPPTMSALIIRAESKLRSARPRIRATDRTIGA